MSNEARVMETVNIPDDLKKTLKKALDNNRLQERSYRQALKDSWNEHSEEIEAVAKAYSKDGKSSLTEHLEGVDHDSKTDLAHSYANHQIKNKDTIPVVIDSATLFFRYQPETKTWKKIDLEMLHKELDAELSADPHNVTVSRHLHNEFRSKMKNHGDNVNWDDFGLDEEKVLMKNGEILDLESRPGEVDKDTREAVKQDYALNAVNAVYDEEAEFYDTRLQDFIQKTVPDDCEREALQQFLGYCLAWPSDEYEKALIILGPTDSGKSTLLKVVKHFFKGSNTSEISFPQLGQKRAFHVEELKQSVINFDHDMAEKALKQRSRVKKIISKEEIYADPKNEKGYSMKPVSNFMIASNHPPDHDGADDAFLKRFLTVEAPNSVSEEEKERDLLEKLTTEKCMNWLLHWALNGYESLKTMNRFSVDRDARETKKLWSRYGDTVSRFVSECVERGTEESKNIPTVDLYEVYREWCEENFEEAEPKNMFISKAADHPVMTKKQTQPFDGLNQRMCFVDIEVDREL